jgi:sigma-B regulation protein RsbU (phosphoserine phosphatase)
MRGAGGPPIRALLVEDDEDQRAILQLLLERLGCEVTTAADGRDGLEIFLEDRPELVLTDWQMPLVSGVQLIQAIRQSLRHQDYCYAILMTASADSEAITQGLASGADSFLRKPVDELELRLGLEAARRVIQLRRHLRRRDERLRRAHNDLRDAFRQMRGDLEAAAIAQAELLPEAVITAPGLRCEWLFRPAAQVGGDMLGLRKLPDGRLFFYQFDVTGHGVRSALLASSLHADLQRAAKQADPLQIVRDLNSRLLERPSDEASATLLCGLADGATGEACMVRAGHSYPLVVRSGGTVETLTDGGLPLGYLDWSDYPIMQIQLSPGDRLVVYSDGLDEQVEENGHSLAALLTSAGNEPLARTIRRLDRARRLTTQADDATVMLIERSVASC